MKQKTFSDNRTGIDFAEYAQKQGAKVEVKGCWAEIETDRGAARIPYSSRHMPKEERKKISSILMWIGLILAVGLWLL